jgi:hypothetical protein
MAIVYRTSRIFIVLLICVAPIAQAQQAVPPEAKALDQFLALPDDEIDLGKVKLTLDRFIDPSIDIEAANRRLNAMVAAVNRMIAEVVPAGRETAMIKMLGLRTYLYDAGRWNGEKVFRYNLEDPLGRNIQNKLLTHYLDTRLGNCLSMPVLFVILGQRLGIDVSLTLAPLHSLVIFKDDKGNMQYLETTSGAHRASKEQLKEYFNITDLAIDNGIYLQPLNKKETVAVIGGTLMEYAMQRGEYNKAMYIANVMMSAHPNNIQAMLTKATAAALIMQRDYPAYIPPKKRWYYDLLVETNYNLFNKAEALGWREPTPEQENRYLENIRKIVQTANTH